MKKILMTLVVVCCVSAVAYAGDTVTLTIGCTIPAIPGVNAPALADGSGTQKEANTIDTQKQDENRKEQSYIYSVIVKNAQATAAERMLSETRNENEVIRTVYSR